MLLRWPGVAVGRREDVWVSRRWFGCSSMIGIVLVNFMTDMGWQERQAWFPSGVCNMDGLFKCIKILSCKRRYGGVHGELLVV